MKIQEKYSLLDCMKITQKIISKIECISNEFKDDSRDTVFNDVSEDILLRGSMIKNVIDSGDSLDSIEVENFRKLDDYLMGLLQEEKKKIVSVSSELNRNHKVMRNYLKK